MIYALPGAAGAPLEFKKRYENFINGQFVAPLGGQYFDVVTPINGLVFTQAARSNEADVELAGRSAPPTTTRRTETFDLDRRAAGVAGASKSSPHSLVQALPGPVGPLPFHSEAIRLDPVAFLLPGCHAHFNALKHFLQRQCHKGCQVAAGGRQRGLIKGKRWLLLSRCRISPVGAGVRFFRRRLDCSPVKDRRGVADQRHRGAGSWFAGLRPSY